MADYAENQPLNAGSDSLIDSADLQVRHGFVKKVFSILSVQLLVTTAICYPFVAYHEWASLFIRQNAVWLQVAMFVPLIVICYMACFPQVARTYPTNYVLLGVITVCMGLACGVSTFQFTPESVAFCAGLTVLVALGLTIFAMQTTYDFTGFGPYLWVGFLILFFMGLAQFFFPPAAFPGFEMVYAGFGSMLFSFYIVYDVQRIVGGKHHQFRFSIDDYVFAALTLYLDIINLFLFLLRIFGSRR